MENLAAGFKKFGTSANIPPLSPNIIDKTITTGPMASAVSVLEASAPTLIPTADAEIPCRASVPRKGSLVLGFKPDNLPTMEPKRTGKKASTGASMSSLDTK